MSYVIRRAEIEDAPALANIQTLSWLAAYEGIIPLDEMQRQGEGRLAMWQKLLHEEGSDIIVIAEIDGISAGFLAMNKTRDTDSQSHIMEVYALYFLPEFWGLGKAKALLKFAMDYARKRRYEGMSLWVLEENKRARRFYEKNDFFYDARSKIIHIGEVELNEMRYWNTLIGREVKWWRLL